MGRMDTVPSSLTRCLTPRRGQGRPGPRPSTAFPASSRSPRLPAGQEGTTVLTSLPAGSGATLWRRGSRAVPSPGGAWQTGDQEGPSGPGLRERRGPERRGRQAQGCRGESPPRLRATPSFSGHGCPEAHHGPRQEAAAAAPRTQGPGCWPRVGQR